MPDHVEKSFELESEDKRTADAHGPPPADVPALVASLRNRSSRRCSAGCASAGMMQGWTPASKMVARLLRSAHGPPSCRDIHMAHSIHSLLKPSSRLRAQMFTCRLSQMTTEMWKNTRLGVRYFRLVVQPPACEVAEKKRSYVSCAVRMRRGKQEIRGMACGCRTKKKCGSLLIQYTE